MHFQLLKLESESDAYEDKGSAWEVSYTSDVLTELGLQDTNLELFMTTWNSSEYPVGPWVFTKLEKKYSDDQITDSSRPDRKLLFDRIKSGISDIAQSSVKKGPQLTKKWFESELRKLLADKAMTEKGEELVLQSDVHWIDLGSYVDGIGRELAKMVLDELIYECLTA